MQLLHKPILWKYIFSALVTYFAATLVMRYSLQKGLFKIKRFGKSSVAEGHALVALVFIIIIATFVSNWLAGYIEATFIGNTQARFFVIFLQTVIILALLLLDMVFNS